MTEDLNHNDLFRRVREDVELASQERQTPDYTEQLIGGAIYLNPIAIRSYLNKAQLLINKQQYNEALEVLNESLNDYPNNAEVYRLMGISFKGLNKFEDAESSFLSSIKIDSTFSKSYFEIAKLNQNIKIKEVNYLKAIKLENIKTEKSINLLNNYYEGISNFYSKDTRKFDTTNLLTEGDEKIKKLINKELLINPKSHMLYQIKARLYLKQKQYENSVEYYKQTLEKLINNEEILKNKAKIYYQIHLLYSNYLHDSKIALEYINKSIKLESRNDKYYAARGDLYSNKLNDFQKALIDYETAIELDQTPENYFKRGVFYRNKLGDDDSALKDLNLAITKECDINFLEVNDNSYRMYTERAKIFSPFEKGKESLKNTIKSLMDYQEGYEQYKIQNFEKEINKKYAASFLTKIAEIYSLSLENYEMAVKYYSEAIFLEPSLEMFLQRANLYIELNKSTLAEIDFIKANDYINIKANRYENLSPGFRDRWIEKGIGSGYRSEILTFEKRVASGLARLNDKATFSELKVTINEFDSDTESFDKLEFIEIKTNLPNSSLSEHILVFFNGSTSGLNSSYYSIDLDGFETDVNGLFVMGNAEVSPSPNYIFEDDLIQNGTDAVAIYKTSIVKFPFKTEATTTNLVDALVYDTSDSDDIELMKLLGLDEQINENENDNQNFESIQRDDNGGWYTSTPTPRIPNDGSGVVLNGITISVEETNYFEGEQITLKLSTEIPVKEDIKINISIVSENFDVSDYTTKSDWTETVNDTGNDFVIIKKGTDQTFLAINTIDDKDVEPDTKLTISVNEIEGFLGLQSSISLSLNDNDYSVGNYGTPINPTYDNVKSTQPVGYYSSLNGLAGQQLINGIQKIIADPKIVRAHSYADVNQILLESDINPKSSNQVWLVYSEKAYSKFDKQTSLNNINKWNREHLYPRSRGGFNDISSDAYSDGIEYYWKTSIDSTRHANSDAHGIRAADARTNSARGNKHFGDFIGAENNKGSFKGDVARSLLFLNLRYTYLELINGYPENIGELGDLNTLLKWNKIDRADDFEMNRNNVIYNWQKNRNPFIDHPELVDYIWGDRYGEIWFNPEPEK